MRRLTREKASGQRRSRSASISRKPVNTNACTHSPSLAAEVRHNSEIFDDECICFGVDWCAHCLHATCALQAPVDNGSLLEVTQRASSSLGSWGLESKHLLREHTHSVAVLLSPHTQQLQWGFGRLVGDLVRRFNVRSAVCSRQWNVPAWILSDIKARACIVTNRREGEWGYIMLCCWAVALAAS